MGEKGGGESNIVDFEEAAGRKLDESWKTDPVKRRIMEINEKVKPPEEFLHGLADELEDMGKGLPPGTTTWKKAQEGDPIARRVTTRYRPKRISEHGGNK